MFSGDSNRILTPVDPKVWRGYFYMGRFGAGTPKRHVVWSSDEQFVAELVRQGGYLSKAEKDALCGAKTARSYEDPRTGQRRHVGVKKTLKQSQKLSAHKGGNLIPSVCFRTGGNNSSKPQYVFCFVFLAGCWLGKEKTGYAKCGFAPLQKHFFLQRHLRTYTPLFGATIARYFRERSLEEPVVETQFFLVS